MFRNMKKSNGVKSYKCSGCSNTGISYLANSHFTKTVYGMAHHHHAKYTYLNKYLVFISECTAVNILKLEDGKFARLFLLEEEIHDNFFISKADDHGFDT